MTDQPGPRGPRPPLRLVEGPPAEDAALVRAFRAGDVRAFGELVRRYQRPVVALLRRYARDLDDAHDLAQRAFLNAFQAAGRRTWLRGEAPFHAWLFRIALNLGRNHVRDARRWARAPAAEAERLPVPPQGSAALERREREAAVRAAVLELPRRQREVLTLRIDAELPFKQIASALGITENNAKVHFHLASRRLRERVAAGGEGPAPRPRPTEERP